MTTTTAAEIDAGKEEDPSPPPDSVPETEQAAAGDAVYITVKDDGKGSGADVAEAKEEDEAAAGDAVVIAVKDDGEGVGKGSRADVAGSKEEDEKVCRICHLSPDRTVPEEGSELVMIGCGCKNELGTAHRQCAETWFRLKGNRVHGSLSIVHSRACTYP